MHSIGIIAITKVAARSAGIACGIFMFSYGVFGKVGAFFTSIPQPVLGGMTTFLFANMTISGVKVMTSDPIDRRERFILACSCSLGLGTIVIPQWFTANFLNCRAIESPSVQGLCDAAVITLTNGFAVGVLTALLLNQILPADCEEDGGLEPGLHPSKSLLLGQEDEDLEEEIETGLEMPKSHASQLSA
jgi:uric acid-xanthine permease